MLMKPSASFLILSVALAFSVPVFGQGTVLFSNKGGGSVARWVSYVDPTQISVPPSGGLVQLAYAPVGTPLDFNLDYSEAEWLAINAGWTLGPTAPFVEPGIFDGGVVTLEGFAPGEQADYVIFGWTLDFGATNFFEARTDIQTLRGGGPRFITSTGELGSPVPLAESGAGLGLVLMGPQVIPEPSISALALLGLGVLLLGRRRGEVRQALPFTFET